MRNASGAGNAFGKFIAWLLVILLIFGIAAAALSFVMRENGVTYYVEYGGKRYFANGDGGNVGLLNGSPNTFSVKSLTGGEVNYSVKITSNRANNFMFVSGDELWNLWNDDAETDDYTEVFNLQKQTDGFSLSIPYSFTVEQAVEMKYGGDIELQSELREDLCYFIIIVSAGESSVNLWFNFVDLVLSLDPPQIIF